MSYYSYRTISEVEEIKFDEYCFMLENMNRAKAKEKLDLLELIIYPQTSDQNRKVIHKRLVKEAVPSAELAKRAVTTDDLKGFGISIEELTKANDGRKVNSRD